MRFRSDGKLAAMRPRLVVLAGLLALSPAACKSKGATPQMRAAFGACAPGSPIEECQKGLNAAGVICEVDPKTADPATALAYRCTMENGKWSHVSVLSSPSDRTRIAHLALDATNASKEDLDAATKAMAASCGGEGKSFDLSAASGFNWVGPGATSPADGQATVSLAEDGMTLEEAWTAASDFGRFTPWLQTCEQGTAQNGPM